MSGIELFIVSALVVICSAALLLYRERAAQAMDRLLSLASHEQVLQGSSESQEIDWAKSTAALSSIGDKLGKAGFFTKRERQRARALMYLMIGSFTLAGILFGLRFGKPFMLVAGTFLGAYFGLCAWFIFIRVRTREFEREVLFQLPLTLESLILLVESGLGVLPSIERLVSMKDGAFRPNPVTRLLRLVYQLASHGMPLSVALEQVADAADQKVLRHILLHLDISGSEGGELIPSLRSLSDHSHTEWRLSVEHRVKRLENSVVFPVFAAVMGLMLLTASVPIVPVLQFRDSLDKTNRAVQSVEKGGPKIRSQSTR